VKTQIIHLNQNDDNLSVRDKMNLSKTGRILLVWPDQGGVINRQLDLTLVKRHAATIGAQLALVTHDSQARFFARQIGISVFDHLRDAQYSNWNDIQPGKINFERNYQHSDLARLRQISRVQSHAWLDHPITRSVCFGISVLALFVLGIFILPSAKIILSPQVEMQSMRFDLIAGPSIASINYSTNTITLANAISRSDGNSVWLYKKSDGVRVLYGSAPDAGAYEFLQTEEAPSAPRNLRITP